MELKVNCCRFRNKWDLLLRYSFSIMRLIQLLHIHSLFSYFFVGTIIETTEFKKYSLRRMINEREGIYKDIKLWERKKHFIHSLLKHFSFIILWKNSFHLTSQNGYYIWRIPHWKKPFWGIHMLSSFKLIKQPKYIFYYMQYVRLK